MPLLQFQHLLQLLVILATYAAGCSASKSPPTTANPADSTAEHPLARPNIIVIYTDDQGYGDASVQNPNAKFQTPHLDRLAHEGIRFTNAHSADAVCTPSRYALLTGRYCWRTTLKQKVLGADHPCLIPDQRVTLASLLRERGYHTAMVGKWHLGMDIPGEKGDRDWTQPVRDMPLDKGFDYFYGIPASLNFGVLAWFEGRFAPVPPTLFTAKKPNPRAGDYLIEPPYQSTAEDAHAVLGRPPIEVAPDFVDNQCLTRFTDQAIDWIQSKTHDAKHGQPFFLYLPYTSPHYPVCPLPQFQGQGQAGAYGEFMIETDHHIGRLMDHLEEAGLDDNTLLIFSSDNGAENAWKRRIEEFGHHSNGVYRGGKRDIYEGGHRVPFIVRWPAGIPQPGRTWDGSVGQVDLLATLAQLTHAPLADDAAEDSHSFLSVLRNPAAAHQRLPLINHGFKGRMSVTDGPWKLIFALGDHGQELYHLGDDPAEQHNLADQHPDVAERLQQQATQIVLNGRTTPGPPQPNDTPHWDHLTWIPPHAYEARQAPLRNE